MSSSTTFRAVLVASAGLFALTLVRDASALQPLSSFLQHADTANPDVREAVATADQRDAEADIGLGRLLPAISARAVYTRNQQEVSFPFSAGGVTTNLVILPLNQIDGYFELDVPIIDPNNLGHYRASKAIAAASKLSNVAAKFAVEKQVVRGYYQVLGAAALVASAKRSEDVARKNLALVRDRREGGLASDLDVLRASADVERAMQDEADTDLALSLAARSLESMTMLTPVGVDSPLPPDDLHEEGPLVAWTANAAELPDTRAAQAGLHAAEVGRDASKLAFVPTLSASANEHVTNATAFTGGLSAIYTLMLTAAIRLDYTLVAQIHQANAAVAVARAQRDKVARSAEDAVFEAWMRVRAGIAKSRAARAQAEVAAQAALTAADRYRGGVATQLDVVTAQRDAFGAEVARVSADADLGAARVMLRLSAGRPADAPATRP